MGKVLKVGKYHTCGKGKKIPLGKVLEITQKTVSVGKVLNVR